MQKRFYVNLFATALCIAALAAAVASAQDDANDVIDPAARFRPYWESVYLKAITYNPAEAPDDETGTQREFIIEGAVEILDDTDLIGINREAHDLLALGSDGTEIYSAVGEEIAVRWYYSLERIRRLAGFGQRADEFALEESIPLDPNKTYPTLLSRVEWTTDILLADTTQTIDLPFEPNENWVELTPGLEIMVETATVSEGAYDYSIEFIYDPNLTTYGANTTWVFWKNEVPPPTMLINMDLLNADGDLVPAPNESGSHNERVRIRSSASDDGLLVGTASGHGSCDSCGSVTTIRYTLAIDPYEQEARLSLENVPVPGF